VHLLNLKTGKVLGEEVDWEVGGALFLGTQRA
jgi:hypothetical protein